MGIIGLLILGVIFFVSVKFLFNTKGDVDQIASREKAIETVMKNSLIRKTLIIDEWIPLLHSEFPECASEITAVSIDSFYDRFCVDWICAYFPEPYASEYRAKTVDNNEFREEIKHSVSDLLPKKIAHSALGSFPSWFDRMDNSLKIAVERSWPKFPQLVDTTVYKT